MILYGKAIAFGVRDLGLIQGIPVGCKARLRMRNDNFAKIYIKQGGRISEHAIEGVNGSKDGPWMVGDEIGRNQR